MKYPAFSVVALIALSLAGPVGAAPTPGETAPDFTAVDSYGKAVKLSDFRGKYVVMEWVNPDCPFVKKHYRSGNMQSLQKTYTGKDVVWLSVSTGVKTSASQVLNAWLKEMDAAPSRLIMDADTQIARQYGAKTTPHMYIINPQGKLVYVGAIDDKRGKNPAEIKSATNYVQAAFNDVFAGKPIAVASTKPYGCSVKY